MTVGLPAEHRWRFEQRDALDGRVQADIEERLRRDKHLLPGVRLGSGAVLDLGSNLGSQRLLDLFVDCGEEVLLAVEVVVERAAADPRALRDLFHRGVREAVPPENLSRGIEESAARPLGALLFGGP